MNNRMLKKLIVVSILFLFLGLTVQPTTSINSSNLEINQTSTSMKGGPWNPEIEGDHFPCGVEYWWLYTMLTLEDGRKWDMCTQFFYVMNWTGSEWSETDGISYVRVQSWDRNNSKYYDCFYDTEHPGPLKTKKDMVDLKFYNTTMAGNYPDYTAHFDDDINDIILNVEAHAIVAPYQHLSSVVNGRIPLGTGTFSYWSIPYLKITGNITIKGETFNVTGVGYQEHLFGDRQTNTDDFRFTSASDLVKVSFFYLSIIKWMLRPFGTSWLFKLYRPHISVDNMKGYDWIWSAFDNGWSMVFVRIRFGYPFSFTEGPAYGILVLTDGNEVWEFKDIYVKITEDEYEQQTGICVPLDMKIMAQNDDKKLLISFDSTTDFTRLYNKFTQIGSSDGGLFLAAGKTSGYFENGEELTSLEGQGTNTPFLLVPPLKYRSLEVQLLLPPDGLGFKINKVTPSKGLRSFWFGFD